LKVFPKTKRIYFIADNTPSGRYHWENAKKTDIDGAELILLDGKVLSHQDLLNELKGISSDSLVLLGAWFVDKNNHFIHMREGYTDISKASPVPVWGFNSLGIGHGIFGGCVAIGSHQGAKVAKMTSEILRGKKASAIPVLKLRR